MANRSRGGGIFRAVGRHRISCGTLYFSDIFRIIITISLIHTKFVGANKISVLRKNIVISRIVISRFHCIPSSGET